MGGDMISQAARILRNISVAVLIGCMLAACASNAPSTHSTRENSTGQQRPVRKLDVGEQAAVVAVRQLGVPYRYGGSTSKGFDCSGLVHYAYSRAGRSIPRTTTALWRSLQPIAANNLRVGDVLFFNIEGKVSHVGLYLGSRRFVHAPSSGREVTIEELDSAFYRKAFVRGGRP
jgi:cell wall-associated NlpC family hydrolase